MQRTDETDVSDARVQGVTKRLLADLRKQHGNYRPGDETHPPHHTSDLTIDHIESLRDGGSLLDESNLRVLCRSANSARR
jgi:5-methylcytosine-specific restriction endonuclease McrA